MEEAPVVVLQGARSVGKSTVLAELARRHDVDVTDLDDLAVRERVAASMSDAVRGPIPVCIDEYQPVASDQGRTEQTSRERTVALEWPGVLLG